MNEARLLQLISRNEDKTSNLIRPAPPPSFATPETQDRLLLIPARRQLMRSGEEGRDSRKTKHVYIYFRLL